MSHQSDSTRANAGSAVSVLTVIKLVGAFVAFLIGSGFATGQEAMQFFVAEGLKGIGGCVIFLVMATYLAVTLLLTGQEHGFRNNEEVFKYYAGDAVGTIFTWYTIIVIYSVYVIMLAGSGSVLHEQFGLPLSVGSGIMALAVFVTLFFGLHELIDVIGSIGPLLIGLVIYLAIATLHGNNGGIAAGNALIPSLGILRASDSWWMSGLLYTALQVMGMFSFLPALGATIENRKELVYAGLFGPMAFFVALVLITLALIASMPEVNGKMIPMLHLAASAQPFIGAIFSYVILAGIFTTTAPLLWIVLVKFTADNSKTYRVLALVLSVFGYLGSMTLPFDRLVNLIYPTVGYSGVILIGFMLARQIRTRSLV